jgi:DNA repair protein RadC
MENGLIETEILPREKLQQCGATALSNEELIALILGSGTRESSVFELSRHVSDYLSSATSIPTVENLRNIRGLGTVKATQILACLELSSRYILTSRAVSVIAPEDLLSRLAGLKFEQQEHFVVVTLNSANYVINVHDVTSGLVTQAHIAPREAFAKAIEDRAVSVVLAHNHPSGSTEPSEQDFAITRLLCAAGKVLQIPVIDHIIVGRGGYTSMCRLDPDMFERSVRSMNLERPHELCL